MDRKQRKGLSKFLSLVLRHRPEAGGVKLDERGFCPVDELAAAAARELGWPVSRDDLETLAAPPENLSQKQRFQVEGDRIRAGHGHSLAIEGYRAILPTGALWHGTPAAAIPSIRSEGLRAMGRQKVHLSYDREITLEAARRRSREVVLIEVDWVAARAVGVGFYASADPRVVLCDDVPPDFLRYH